MAKGAEDTTFYLYNRFISLNEVGADPSLFGSSAKDFHEFMSKRQELWPLSMNATATHDTKRGEDVRARLNVLSEIPREWAHQVRLGNKFNRNKKKFIAGLQVRAPVRNDEYFIYQTLIGTYPSMTGTDEHYVTRIEEYVIKALREAQLYTSWAKPHSEYEEACLSFLGQILKPQDGNKFLDSFIAFQQRISTKGAYNSLSQALLKMTCPGIPDFYQGCELWDFSLVDPDNRRAVDYEHRMNLLRGMQGHDSSRFLQGLLDHKEDGRIKLFLINKILTLRKSNPDLFLKGSYVPLVLSPELEKYVIAFARRLESEWVITAVPRLSTQLIEKNLHWKDVFVVLPPEAPAHWMSVITGREIHCEGQIPIREIFGGFPVACWKSKV